MTIADLKYPGGGFLLGLITTQFNVDLTALIVPVAAALVGLLWKFNSRLVAIETQLKLMNKDKEDE